MSTLHTVKASLRPTLRDARKHWWRSLLAVLLVALPVGVFAFSTSSSAIYTKASQAVEQRNVATFFGGSCKQNVEGWGSDCEGNSAKGAGPSDALNQALPSGFEATINADTTAKIQAVSGKKISHQTGLAIRAPENLRMGDATPGIGDIALPVDTAQRLGVHPGDKVKVEVSTQTPKDQQLKATKELTVNQLIGSANAVIIPGTLFQPEQLSNSVESSWVLSGPRPLSWDDVKALNAKGFVVRSKDVMDNPPPAEELYPGFEDSSVVRDFYFNDAAFLIVNIAAYAIIAILILLVVAPVFAISASKRGETFALMRSQGATRRDIRIAVLGYGLVAGVVGALLGTALGLIACFVFWRIKAPSVQFATHLELLPIGMIFAIIGALIASYLPAWLAARSNISQGADGGRIDRVRRWRNWMAIGPVMLLVFFIFAGLSQASAFGMLPLYALWFDSALTLLYALIATVLCVPAVILGCGVLRKPLMLRLAATLMRRQMLRSGSALAALAGITLIAFTLVSTEDMRTQRMVDLTARSYNTAAIGIAANEQDPESSTHSPQSLTAAASTVEAEVPVKKKVDVYHTGGAVMLPGLSTQWYTQHCPNNQGIEVASSACDVPESDNPATFLLGTYAEPLVAKPEILEFFNLKGNDLAQAKRALEQGKVLVSKDAQLDGVQEVETSFNDAHPKLQKVEMASLLPENTTEMVMTPQVAEELGYTPSFWASMLLLEHPLDGRTAQTLDTTLRESAPDVFLYTYPAPKSVQDRLMLSGLLLVPLVLVVAISAVLGLGELRRMQRQLADVGATPAQLRALGATSTCLLAALGTVVPMLIAMMSIWISSEGPTYGEDGTLLRFGQRDWVHFDPILVLSLGVVFPLVALCIGAAMSWRQQTVRYRMD